MKYLVFLFLVSCAIKPPMLTSPMVINPRQFKAPNERLQRRLKAASQDGKRCKVIWRTHTNHVVMILANDCLFKKYKNLLVFIIVGNLRQAALDAKRIMIQRFGRVPKMKALFQQFVPGLHGRKYPLFVMGLLK